MTFFFFLIAVGRILNLRLSIYSDRMKCKLVHRLQKVVLNVFPQLHHGRCFSEFFAYFRVNFSRSCLELFVK
jgi:hypothetical protein